jgi:hypothetical protein
MVRDMDSEHDVCSILFEECSVDLIGPWTVQVRGRPYKFEALTVIDTVTNQVKLVRIERIQIILCKSCAMLANTLTMVTMLYT